MRQLEFLLAPLPPPLRRRAAETRCYLDIDGEILGYLLKRSKRRSIGLTVDTDGLHVAAPQRAPQAMVEAYILANRKWVLRKTRDWARYRETLPQPWRIGDPLPFVGAELATQFAPAICGARRVGGALEIGVLPITAVADWLKQQAMPLFAGRVAHYAGELGLPLPSLRLSNAQTRWGSCTATGRITLNWRLVHFRLEVIDYVVVHELAHLRELNHSSRFWDIVAAALPDYADAKKELRTGIRRLPDL
jgi:predicted metal-dependent hydrolase